MKVIRSRFLAASVAIGLSASALMPTVVRAEIAGTLAVGVVLDRLFSELNNTITSALQKGDYLLARAGLEAKDAIETWRSANASLLDKAFSELSTTQREVFAKADALTAKVDDAAADRLETIRQISESANQIIESIPLISGGTYVLRYGPRIVISGAPGETILTIRGVNLDDADPQLSFGTTPIPRISLTQQEAQFAISSETIPSVEREISRQAFRIAYKVTSTNFLRMLVGSKDSVERDLALIVFPKFLGTYQYSTVLKVPNTTENTVTVGLDQFKARNDRVYKVARPPEGWSWDIGKPFRLIQGHGEAGRCEGVDLNRSTKDGVSVFARLDEIREIGNFWGIRRNDGYVTCSLQGTIFKTVDIETPGPEQTGDITWREEIPLPRPDNTVRTTLRVDTFDKLNFTIDGDRAEKSFEVKVSSGRLLISPKIPDDTAE